MASRRRRSPFSLRTSDGPDDSRTVTITATDSDGASSSTSFALTVSNVAPSVGSAASSVSVAEGGTAIDQEVVSQLLARRRADDPLEELTPREREVLELMAEGRSNQAISERMFVTMRAVEKHVTSIFVKLRLPAASEDHRRVLAVLAFLKQ